MDIFQYVFHVSPVVVDPVCFIIVEQNLYVLAASLKNLQAVLLTAFSSSEEQGKNMQLPGEEAFDFFSSTRGRAKSSMAAQDCYFHGGLI